MHDKGEWRALMHEVVQERKRVGKSVWALKINVSDIWSDEERSASDRYTAIAVRIRSSEWASAKDPDDYLFEILDNLAEEVDVEELNGWWNELYDIADVDRVWINVW